MLDVLPNYVAIARSNRATEAVSALQKLHTTKKRGPVAHSLFLDQILAFSGGSFRGGENFVGDRFLTTVSVTSKGLLQLHEATSGDAAAAAAAAAAGIGGGSSSSSSSSTGIGSFARAVEERIMNTIAESKVIINTLRLLNSFVLVILFCTRGFQNYKYYQNYKR